MAHIRPKLSIVIAAHVQSHDFPHRRINGNRAPTGSAVDSWKGPMQNQRFKPKPVKITDITRQALIDRISLITKQPPWGDDLIGFLRRIFPLNQMPSTEGRFKDAEGDIWRGRSVRGPRRCWATGWLRSRGWG